MSGSDAGLVGGKGSGPILMTAATSTSVGAITLPFTGGHHTISIVGLSAITFGVIVLVAHLSLRMAGYIARRA